MRTTLLLIASQVWSWGAIAFVQATNHGHTSSTASPTVSITPTVGNTLILAVTGSQNTAFTLTSCTDDQSPANTYIIDQQKQHSTSTAIAVALVHARIATASGAITITCTASTASYFFTVAAEFSGIGATATDGSGATGERSTTPYDCGSFIPTPGKNEVIVAGIATGYTGGALTLTASGTSGTYTIPMNGKNDNGGPYTAGGLEYQVVTSTSGAYNPQFTTTPTPAGACVSMVYQAGSTAARVLHEVINQ